MTNSPLLAADPAFPQRKLSETLLDVATLILCLFFICASACSIPVAIFLLIFCELP